MFQASGVRSMSSTRGELGKYVNRLGWAVSSEEQRLAAAGRIRAYGHENVLPQLEEFATKLEAVTSLVFNPEGAIDAAVGADMKINLLATNRELLMAFNLTREAGFSEEMAQTSLSNAIFSLMSEDDTIELKRIARAAGVDTKDMDNPSIVRAVLAKNNKASQELIGLVNLTSENVGNALVSNTAKQIGMIRALQELYPDIDFNGIGMVGFDEYATHLKLSGITSKKEYGDINRVLDAIAEGGREVYVAHEMEMPEGSVIRQVGNLTRAGGKGNKIKGEQVKLQLLKIMGLDKDGKENFGTVNVDDVMQSAMKDMALEENRLGRIKYNPFAPSEPLAARLKTGPLDQAMKSLTDNITGRLEGGKFFGKSMQDLVIENNLLREVKDVNFNMYTLNPGGKLAGRLVERGVLSQSEIDQLLKRQSRSSFDQAKTIVIGRLKASENFAQQEAGTAIQEFFTAHIQRFIDKEVTIGPELVMEKLLFEIEEMKNATRMSNPSMIQETLSSMGYMLENALSSDKPIVIEVPGMEKFSVQQLSAFVRNKNELMLTGFLAQKQTDDMAVLIKALSDNRMITDPDLNVPENLMNKDFLSELFQVDKKSATNIETGLLKSIPKLVNTEEVQQVLDGMAGSSIDLELLEDFLAFDGDNLDLEGGIIGQRIRNVSAGKTEEEIAQEITNRIRLIGTIRKRYTAQLESQRPEYLAFDAMLEGGEVTAEGIVTPTLRSAPGERPMETIDEAIRRMVDGFKLEADEETERLARSAVSSTFADTGPVVPGKYTRIQDFIKSPKMREMYQGALRNKGKIAGVAALATGLAVFGSINKKERTQEAISGPPLLPGGNPYERIPTQQMQIPDAPIASGNQGMSYNISVDGDQDKMEEFMNRARISNKWKYPRYYA